MSGILLVSDGFFHPPFLARRQVRQTLGSLPGYQLSQVRHINSLASLDIERFQAMVFYFHHNDIAPDALAAVEQFVHGGGGILAIHSATASFQDQPRFCEVLGGCFAGHGPVESFEIRPTLDDGLFGGIGPFVVEDELYIHDLQPDIQVHFTAQYEEKPQPLVWTRAVGDGRVCTVSPGHRTATVKQPEIQEILRRGLIWAVQ
jgi:type 1 glutamine amidotransferase